MIFDAGISKEEGKTSVNKIDRIRTEFEKRKDPARAVSMAKYMRHQFPFYGIPAPERRKAYREILKEEKEKKVIDWDLLDACYREDYREFQYFVYDYLLAMKRYLVYEDIPRIQTYIQKKSWWDTIDFLDQVIGEIGLKDDRVDALMEQWSVDDDFWLRRIAIDHQLGRKDQMKPELLAKIIKNNLDSDEFFIQKAIGWSLRDYSKTNPRWVRGFIEEHRGQMTPLSLREACRYL